MNISSTTISGNCEFKCALSFDYNTSGTCVATNNGNTISMSYDKGKVLPVVYNGNKYVVDGMTLTYSSTLLYNNNTADAELSILHRSDNAKNGLNIVIPISVSPNASSSPASTIITQVISGVASSAPATENNTTLNIPNYNLNNIIPKKPFYSFHSSSPDADVVVFGIENAISISSATLETFKKLANKKPVNKLSAKAPLYYNPKGPVVGDLSDQIYIDCQPVNSSSETVDVDGNGNLGLSGPKFKPQINNTATQSELYYFIIFMVVLLIVAMYYAVQTLLKMADVKVNSPLTSRFGRR